ncbi:hypothetical protein BGZ97_006932 [Linnemannia gamsii]|uniref:Uncharacterized protein n=1 Tax=Linnemannia gamsii TaxID=64522 RepID=A0A9P6QNK6_9FUNG|nr:hypothetical protein BGZ97_006932 [Linnemannia gamsii]
MKFSLKVAALSALVASTVLAAPVIEKRDANSDRIAACFVGLIFTGSWPGSCKAAIAVDLGLIRSIAINQMTMDFTTANPWAPTMASNNVVATMLSIPGITLPIDSVRQHVIVIDNGVQLGAFDTPWSAASVNGAVMTTAFTTSALNVFPEAKAAFSSFVGSLSTKAEHPVTLKGSVDAKLNLGIFGHLTIPGIGFNAVVPFKGLNNLQNMKYIYAIEVNPSIDGNIYLAAIISINNPSQLTVTLGDVTFDASHNGAHIGTSAVKALKLVPGDNQVISYTTLDMSLTAAQQFSDSLAGASQVMSLAGFAGSSTNPALNGGLGGVRSGITIPQFFQGSSMSQIPYKNWSIKVSPTKVATVTATFQSPYYGYPYQMVNANMDGYQNKVQGTGMTPTSTDMALWYFKNNNVNFSVSGTGTVTVSFEVDIPKKLQPLQVRAFTDMVNYGKANGKVLVNFDWAPVIIVNGDGVERIVDWTSIGNAFDPIPVAVGDDFANILLQL